MADYSRVAQSVPASGVRDIMERALHMSDVIRLEVGEPAFAPAEHVTDAVARYVREGDTHYVANAGIMDVRRAAAGYLQRLTGVTTQAEQVMVTSGAMQALSHAFNILLDPGDEILLPDPGWPNYTMAAALRQATAVYYPLPGEQGFLPAVDDLQRLVTRRCKAILLCTPSNPTGQKLDPELLGALGRFAEQHDLFVISDEVYAEIVFDGDPVSALQHIDPQRVIGIFSLSKSHAMTGFRIGITRASESYVTLATNLQEATTSCPTAFAQRAAIDALQGPQDYVAQMREAYRERRDLAVQVLREYGLYEYTPRGAFYLLVNIARSRMSSHSFALILLQEQRVAVAPGDCFGEVSAAHVRVSLAASAADVEAGLRRLCDTVNRAAA
ncbi:MAG: aminotransferase class I/II-fold pyridoxal phosphate-dependent enzyme [Gammaproteobacteria bacterium]|nr:aminotransferase class I/II-fold pyridoxal phosphate-dependent enzyme [Gammaproteobacteria bacterium]